VRVSSVFAASVLCTALLSGAGQAQVPSSSAPSALGFMPPYEITRTVRRAGFDPLAPPMREGSTYVVRATDYRGILMRVVIDARSGAIRDATRIVAGPGSYGPQIGMVPYEPIPNERPMPYGPAPADYDAPPADDGEMPPPRTPAAHPVTRASVMALPPLPRPRPPELASRTSIEGAKPGAAKPAAVTDTKPDQPAVDAKSETKLDTKSETKSDTKSPEKPDAKSDVTGAASVAAPSAPPATPAASAAPAAPAPSAPATAAVKPKLPAAPPIND
jgi:hypothetical protein